METVMWVLAIGCTLQLILIGAAKFNAGIDDSWRQQIADHGCAEFYLDEKHERQWRWKDAAPNH